MWMRLKRVLYIVLLACLFSVPATGADAAYQMTAQKMSQLEDIFSQLDSRQKQQQALLNRQAEQLTKLNEQLETSRTEIEKSKKATATLQTSLTAANESLQASAQEAKRTQKRIERQRDTWAVVTAIILGISLSNR